MIKSTNDKHTMTRKKTSFTQKFGRFNKYTAVLSGLVVLGGGYYIIQTSAATSFSAVEPENGSRTVATVVSDNTASGGQALQFGSGPAPEPPQPPASWQEAFDSRNQAIIDAWYVANTGFQALNLNSSTFRDISGDNLIDQNWLNANNGNGNVRQLNGRWIIENVKSSRIRIAVNNVTVRGCLINGGGTTLYGIQHYPTWDNDVTGTIIEYCTVNGQSSEGVGMLLAGRGTGENVVILRYNEIFGWRGGIQMYGDATFEYNRSHSVYYFEGSHNTAASNRGANVRILRNSLEDGSSSALSIYADGPIYNMVVQENIFNTPVANYCVNFPGSKTYFEQTYDTHLIGNIFGQKHNPKCGSSGPMAGGKWTTNSGNIYTDGTNAF